MALGSFVGLNQRDLVFRVVLSGLGRAYSPAAGRPGFTPAHVSVRRLATRHRYAPVVSDKCVRIGPFTACLTPHGLGICHVYGGDDQSYFLPYMYWPNRYVYNLLLETAGKRGEFQQPIDGRGSGTSPRPRLPL